MTATLVSFPPSVGHQQCVNTDSVWLQVIKIGRMWLKQNERDSFERHSMFHEVQRQQSSWVLGKV